MKKKLGATGRFPRGKMNPDDQGEIQFAVGSDPVTKKVVLKFGRPVAWLGMGPDDADRLAQSLVKHARRVREGDHV